MKYYSDLTKKLYDTEKQLKEAEVELTKSKADRAQRAKEVTEAIKAANNLSKSPKWIPGYGGVTCSIDFYYYPGGKVSASGAQYKYDQSL